MKRILLSFCLLAFVALNVVFSQGKLNVDSLVTVLNKYPKEDTVKVKMLITLSKVFHRKANYEKAKEYCKLAISIADKIDFKKGKADALHNIGIIYRAQLNYYESIKSYLAAIKIREAIGDINGIAYSSKNLGDIYREQGNHPDAMQKYIAALKIREKMGDKMKVAACYGSIGNVYYFQHNYAEAIKNHLASLKILEELGDKIEIATTYINLGVVYLAQKNYSEAMKSFLTSLKIYQELDSQQDVALSYENIGDVYEQQQNYPEAMKNYLSSLKIFEELDDQVSVNQVYTSIGNLNIKLKNFQEAKKQLERGLAGAKELGSKDEIKFIYQSLSNLYSETGNWKEAYTHFQLYILYQDSLINQENTKKITETTMQYEFDKKETELKYQQQLTAEQLEKEKLLTLQQGQTLTLKEQALALSNKEKDLAHLAFLKEQAEKQEKEQALLLAQKDKDLTGVQLLNLAKEKALQLQEIARKNATIGFLGASMLAILLAAALFYLWLKKRQAQTEATRQAELQAGFTQQLFAETESERARIARDLHDGISHELLGLKRTSLPANSDAAQKIDGVIESIRQISRNLHPVMLDSIGLQLSIESFCEQFAEAHNLFVNYEVNYSNELHKNTELQVFRIIQEALTNTAKHAKAQAANVSLSDYGNGVLLKIQDNGKGFEVEKALNSGKAFGLQSIIERAKIINTKANIYSTPNGTIIELKIS